MLRIELENEEVDYIPVDTIICITRMQEGVKIFTTLNTYEVDCSHSNYKDIMNYLGLKNKLSPLKNPAARRLAPKTEEKKEEPLTEEPLTNQDNIADNRGSGNNEYTFN